MAQVPPPQQDPDAARGDLRRPLLPDIAVSVVTTRCVPREAPDGHANLDLRGHSQERGVRLAVRRASVSVVAIDGALGGSKRRTSAYMCIQIVDRGLRSYSRMG